MAHETRRTIDELAVRYELEPTLRDLYAEGSADQAVLSCFINECSPLKRGVVYEIDSIDVSSELACLHGMPNNKRGRTIVLANELNKKNTGFSQNVLCIVDDDFDRVNGVGLSNPLLLSTDYSCMEGYLFDVPVISKFLTIVIRNFPVGPQDLLDKLLPPLLEMFAIRLAGHSLRWQLDFPPMENYCASASDGITFKNDAYIDSLLHSSRKFSWKSGYLRELEQSKVLCSRLSQPLFQGHDFLNLLTWFVKRKKRGAKLDSSAAERSLYACLDNTRLASQPLFGEILKRIA